MGFQSERRSATAPGAAGPETVRPDSPAPEPAAIHDQLDRILASSDFQGSERTRRFLRYVVEETLAGRGERIKAFSVALAAFDRDETFNPQLDPIVRIEAGRMRRCLERYYLVAGAAGDVLIEVPKGGYTPTFSWFGTSSPPMPAGPPDQQPAPEPELGQPALPSPPATRLSATAALIAVMAVIAGVLSVPFLTQERASRAPETSVGLISPQPSIAVLSFSVSGDSRDGGTLATGMANEIVRELSRHAGMVVLGPRSFQRFGPAPDVTVVGQEAGVTYVLSGDVQHGQERVRVAVQLSEAKHGSVVWAETFDRDFSVGEIFDLQAEIGREAVRRIVQPQGAIALFDWKRTKGMAPETWEAYDCVVQAEDLHRRGIIAFKAAQMRACLKRAVEEEPSYADPWIMLALLEVDAVRYRPRTRVTPEVLDAALAAARQGIELAPDNGRAHMAMMLTLYFQGDIEHALAVGAVALKLSPQDPDVIGEVGLRHVFSGSPSTGLQLLRRAAGLYSDVPAGLRLALALAYLRQGDPQQASDVIATIDATPNFVYWSVAAAVHGKAGRQVAAEKAAEELVRLYPDFSDWALEELSQRHIAPDLAASMVEGWRAAGLEIASPPSATSNP